MRSVIGSFAVALALAPALCLADDAGDQVTAAYAAWDQAFGSGDAKQVAAFYTEDAVFLPPTHEVMAGPAGVEKFFVGLFEAGGTAHKLEGIEVVGGGDDAAGASEVVLEPA